MFTYRNLVGLRKKKGQEKFYQLFYNLKIRYFKANKF